jgi:hypothetical protein
MYGFAMTAEVMLATKPAAASTTSEPLRCLLVVRFNMRLEIVFTRRG